MSNKGSDDQRKGGKELMEGLSLGFRWRLEISRVLDHGRRPWGSSESREGGRGDIEIEG